LFLKEPYSNVRLFFCLKKSTNPAGFKTCGVFLVCKIPGYKRNRARTKGIRGSITIVVDQAKMKSFFFLLAFSK